MGERKANKAVIGTFFCFAPFWGGFATLPQNSTTQKMPYTAALAIKRNWHQGFNQQVFIAKFPSKIDRGFNYGCHYWTWINRIS
jgi:hypothetical protein